MSSHGRQALSRKGQGKQTTRVGKSHDKPHKRLTALSLAHRLWEAIDTPVSLSCHILARNGEFKQLVEKGINPSHYRTPRQLFLDYQAVKLLSRFPHLKTGIDTEAVALKAFVDAEVRCRETNEFIRSGGFSRLSESVQRVISGAQRKIATILGDVPSLEDIDFAFGPGAAFGVRGDTSVFNKVSSTLECTYAFADQLSDFLSEFPGWIPEGQAEVKLVPGSQLTVVPKNAKTDRPICIEPLLNGLYQKGFGTWIRGRLQRFGVDLDDQGINQRLASRASVDNLATVDFKSASDTISYLLVMDLLPFPWFEALDVARSPRYQYGDRWYNFHKFTSMGNAYTFELETLIFYAIATSACEVLGIEYKTGVNLSVYGDDVIIPQEAFSLFSEASEACGFWVNENKSFFEGQFFESCGHDYFMGSFVRPFLLSRELDKLTASFYAANSIKRISKRFADLPLLLGESDDPDRALRYRDVYDWVVGCIPPYLRVVGPEGFGDGHLVGALPRDRIKGQPGSETWDGYWFYTYVERAARIRVGEVPQGYALYFARGRSVELGVSRDRGFGLLQLGWLRESDRLSELDRLKREGAAPLDNGGGYSVRGRTFLSRTKVFCNFTWQDLSW